jgi:VanZ family protein
LNKGTDKGERARGFFREYFPPAFLFSTIGYCGIIYILSSIPSLSFPPPFPHFDKLVHFFEYGGLGALVVMGMRRAEYEYSGRMLVVVPVVFCLLSGLSDEVHQLFVPGRMFSLADLAADVAGAACAAGLIVYLQKARRRQWLKEIRW